MACLGSIVLDLNVGICLLAVEPQYVLGPAFFDAPFQGPVPGCSFLARHFSLESWYKIGTFLFFVWVLLHFLGCDAIWVVCFLDLNSGLFGSFFVCGVAALVVRLQTFLLGIFIYYRYLKY